MKLFLVALLVNGVVSFETNARIVGGSDANIADYPWQGALLDSEGSLCGAVLISANQVLTAAHCVHGREDPTLYTVRFGSSRYNTGGNVYPVKKITKHSYFDEKNLLNDIAALELMENAGGNNISPISKLDNREYEFLHSNCQITGWGLTSFNGGDLSNTLQAANTTCITKSQCSQHMQGWNFTIVDQHQCLLNNVSRPCLGDSGGPLSCQDRGENTLVGLDSFTLSTTCGVDKPSGYARISYFCDWIRTNTGVSCPVFN